MYNLYLSIFYLIYYSCIIIFLALAMSKLRANITYSHRLHNDPSFIEPAIDINNTNQDSDNIL